MDYNRRTSKGFDDNETTTSTTYMAWTLPRFRSREEKAAAGRQDNAEPHDFGIYHIIPIENE